MKLAVWLSLLLLLAGVSPCNAEKCSDVGNFRYCGDGKSNSNAVNSSYDTYSVGTPMNMGPSGTNYNVDTYTYDQADGKGKKYNYGTKKTSCKMVGNAITCE